MKKTFAVSALSQVVLLAIASNAMANQPANNEVAVLDEVTVVGSLSKTGKVEYMSPKSASVLSSEKLAEQGSSRLDSALRYEAGVLSQPYGADNDANWFKIRGFDASVSLDGNSLMPVSYFTWLPSIYGLEAVEVVKGADSLTYGAAETGGLVNLISKRPHDEAKGEINLTSGTRSERGVSFDYNSPLANGVYGRIVGEYNKQKGTLNGTWLEHYYLAPSVKWDISDRTSLTVLTSIQKDVGVPTNGFFPREGTLTPTAYGKIDRKTNLGDPTIDRTDRSQISLGYEFAHDFGHGVKFTQNYRFGRLNQDLFGLYDFSSTLVNQQSASRQFVFQKGNATTHSVDNRLSKMWKGDNFENTLIFGLDYNHLHAKGSYRDGSAATIDNVYAPNYGVYPSVEPKPYFAKNSQLGMYLQNHATFYNKFVVNAGLRYDEGKTSSSQWNNWASPNQERKESDFNNLSLSGGLMYITDAGVSPYISYSESFKPNATTTGNGKPYIGKKQEAGIKYLPSFVDGTFSVAVFKLDEKNSFASDGSANGTTVDKSKSHGTEVQANVNVTENLATTLAYTYTKAKTQYNNAYIPTPTIPKHTASAFVNYRFTGNALDGLSMNAGVRYVGTSDDQKWNKGYKVPAYTLIDLGAQYQFNKNWLVRVNATNLADKKYVSACNWWCYYGEGRKVTANVSYKF